MPDRGDSQHDDRVLLAGPFAFLPARDERHPAPVLTPAVTVKRH